MTRSLVALGLGVSLLGAAEASMGPPAIARAGPTRAHVQPPAPSAPALTALSVIGPVTRSGPSGVSAPLVKGEAVRDGDRIATAAGAFVTLAQPDGSRVTLAPRTVLRVAVPRRPGFGPPDRTRLVMEEGTADVTVKPLGMSAGRFGIRTPAALATAGEAAFRIAYDRPTSRSTVEVTEGRVAESAPGDTAAADIASGLAARRRLGGERRILPLPAAPSLLPPDAVQLPPRLVLRIAAPRAGWSYHVVLARDPDFAEAVAETTTSTGVARFESAPPGPLSARITAIDENGVEGYAKLYTLMRLVPPGLPASNR